MASTDPTADLLHSLTDPDKWELVSGVVVFRAHERELPAVKVDGKEIPARTVKVTDADLPGIADRLNEQVRRSGQLLPLTVGHRSFNPAVPETAQPPLVGFARNYRVDWVQRDGERFLAVLEDEYVMRDRRDVLRQYPYRSIDYDTENKTSVGTALLVRPPFLKMGTVCVYSGVVTMAGENQNPPAPAATAGQPSGDDFSPEEVKTYDRFCRYMAKRHPKLAQYMGPADGGQPSAAGASPPPPPASPPPPPAANANPVIPVEYAARFAAMEQRLQAETTARVTAECRTLLDPLKDRIAFDYQRELAALVGMPTPEQRAAHVLYMGETYRPLPTGYGGGFIPVAPTVPPPAGNDPTKPPPKYDQIMAYMRSEIAAGRSCSYEQAEAKIVTG